MAVNAGVLVGLLLLAASASRAPRAAACLHSLRRPPYETYWLGTYHDSRFLSLTCFALRSFRWTLKFIKVTYERWHTEMEFAKCVSESYGMNIPPLTPPWTRQLRSWEDGSTMHVDALDLPVTFQGHQLAKIPLDFANSIATRLQPTHIIDTESWQKEVKTEKFMASIRAVSSHKNEQNLNYLTPDQIGPNQQLLKIARSLYQYIVSVIHKIKIQLSKTLGFGIVSCVGHYAKSAFWRWIDSAPFLK